jgi:hypothetical protein
MTTAFKHSFTLIVSGSTGYGKSSFCINLLKHLDTVCTERNFDGGIIWFYSEKTAFSSQKLAEMRKKVTYHEGVPDGNFLENAEWKQTLILLDDLLHSAYSSKV